MKEWIDMKRFSISKPYEGPPVEAPWGGKAEGLYETVEEYDDEYTARVRVAVLNEGLGEKKYRLDERVDDEDTYVEVDTEDPNN